MVAQPARKRIIVDAQVHLWKAESADWKWVPGAKPQLPETFTIEKLVPMMNEAGVDRAVIVPPGPGSNFYDSTFFWENKKGVKSAFGF